MVRFSGRAGSSKRCRCFFFQAEDGIRDRNVTGVQTCALPILGAVSRRGGRVPAGGGGAAPATRRAGGSAGVSGEGGRGKGRGRRRAGPASGARGREIGRASCRERVK